MKVSFYELLGMIKENKQPKKVIYDDVVYMWANNGYEKKDVIMPSLIVMENKSLRCKINDNKMLDKNITILEPNEEIIEEDKKIEKIDFRTLNTQKEKNRVIKDTINEIIDKLNKMEDNK